MEENLNKKINLKKIIIFILIILFLLGICAFGVIFINKKNSKTSETYLIDNNFNITIENKYKLTPSENFNNHILELYSQDNLNVYIDKIENTDDYSLLLIARGDKDSYSSNFKSVSNLSEIQESYINGFPTATYSFEYANNQTNTPYYLQIIFIEINNNIYTIDIEFPVSESEKFSPMVSDILSTISVDVK